MARGATDYLRQLLVELVAHPNERRRYADVEAALSWPRSRLAGVLGGFAARFRKTTLGNRRPWHIHFDADGVWWIWMDETQAEGMTLALGNALPSADMESTGESAHSNQDIRSRP